ncbi:MAG TPA: hypothetical protein DD001_05730, partial [Microcoleaceae bacterium UBA10368]|nr:hypothetical protein [Microcoleaceae cyanobacterium UBA10368]
MTEQKFDPDDRKNQLSPQLKLSFWRVPSFITFGLLLIALLFFGFNRNQQVASKDMATLLEGNTKFALNL